MCTHWPLRHLSLYPYCTFGQSLSVVQGRDTTMKKENETLLLKHNKIYFMYIL